MVQFCSESLLGIVGTACNRLGEHNFSPMPIREPETEKLTRGVITRLLAKQGLYENCNQYPTSTQLSGCSSVWPRVPALEAGSRWFKSSHPDHFHLDNNPLSAESSNTLTMLPCGLRLYCFHSRIDKTTFVIAEPTAPVQPLSLLLGTICHRIFGHVYSLDHRVIGRYGNPKRQRYLRVISDFTLSGISNSGRHIKPLLTAKGLSSQTLVTYIIALFMANYNYITVTYTAKHPRVRCSLARINGSVAK